MPRGQRSSQAPSVSHAGPSNAKAANERQDARLDQERQKLIAERHNELGSVMSRHEDLLREQFHLNQYGFLLYFDRNDEKLFNTNDFAAVKAKHDLTALLPESSSSRTTRRAQTSRLSSIAPTPALTPTLIRAATSTRNVTPSVKGKEKEVLRDDSASATLQSRQRRRTFTHTNSISNIAGDERSVSFRGSKRKAFQSSTPPRQVFELETPRTKRSRSGIGTSAVESDRHQPRHSVRPTTSGKTLPRASSTALTPINNAIRRVKLIVRQPPPMFSSPKQRPELPAFNRSLSALLSSYCGHKLDGDIARLEKSARITARKLNRIAELKAQGRLVEPERPDRENDNVLHQPGDLWAKVVRDAVDQRQNMLSRHRFGRGGALAAAAQSRVNGYWEAIRRDERIELEREGKRVRLLANGVMRLITAEWYKVYNHIREEERLKEEAEDVLRGRKHLDAILDQSGQILEKQQMELVRDDDDASDETSSSSAPDDDEFYGDATSEVTTEPPDASNVSVYSASKDYLYNPAPLNDTDAEEPTILDFYPRREKQDSGTQDDVSVSDIDQIDNQLSESASQNGDMEKEPVGEVSDPFQHDMLSGVEYDLMQVDEPLTHPAFDDAPHRAIRVNGRGSSSPIEHAFHPSLKASSRPSDSSEGAASISQPPPHPSTSSSDQNETSPSQPEPAAAHVNGVNGVNGINGHAHGEMPVEKVRPIANGIQLPDVLSSPGAITSQQELADENLAVAAPGERANGIDRHDAESSRSPSPVLQRGPLPEETVNEQEPPPDLQPFAVTRMMWRLEAKILPPLLLRGNLRPYQQSGLEWLVSLNNNKMNGILADEMGLGKTIQTIALLAHLACDRGIWGPHLIIVPTSVLLNWEMEFKKFLPGFRILSYHGTAKRRKELRQGWFNKFSFNVCVTSYTLAIKDQHIFKRKAWYYMILDEAHMIKNFKSQRWNTLLTFKSYRRLLLTGTPLQNNLTELWALLQFLMTSSNFANQKEFSEWFSNPLEKAIEQGTVQDQEVQLQVSRLHSVLRPYLLRRLKADVEKELPKKYDHLVLCRLSKRQRFLYDEFMSRSQTKSDLQSGIYQKIANILMQLRKVCNHPDLFEVRPIVTSFAMGRSAIADYEIKELLVRRRLLSSNDEFEDVNFSSPTYRFIDSCNTSIVAAREMASLREQLPDMDLGLEPKADLRSISGFRAYDAFRKKAALAQRFQFMDHLNRTRCNRMPWCSSELIQFCEKWFKKQALLTPIKTYAVRAEEMSSTIERFAFATPPVVAVDISSIVMSGVPERLLPRSNLELDAPFHQTAVKLQIAFPDPSLLQYDCGKLQELANLLRERKKGGHRVLIFTQMTRILDLLEMFLNFHGYLYLRLDGATKIEDRQYITERFNVDTRVFAFIASSRSGGVGINLTGADTVIFYDSDFNPQMDRQCEDRAHRIGQVRDVHIYRFISQYTVEEAMLRKANQKRSLDDLVIQKGDFDWQNFFRAEGGSSPVALQKALMEFEDIEDANAAKIAANEEAAVEGEERAEFADGEAMTPGQVMLGPAESGLNTPRPAIEGEGEAEAEGEEGETVTDYMLRVVRADLEYFRTREWRSI